MTYIDIFILFIILSSLAVGLYKGFVREVLALGTLVVAVAAAFYSYLSGYPLVWLPSVMTDYSFSISDVAINGRGIANVIIFIFIFFFIIWVGNGVSRRLGNIISASPVNFFNRILGGVFGLLRGAVIVVSLIILAGATKLPDSQWWNESQILPTFIGSAKYTVGLMPPEYAQYFDFGVQDQSLPDKIQL